jgi:small GTP-binding protein
MDVNDDEDDRNPPTPPSRIIKIVMTGSTGVGKSAMMARYDTGTRATGAYVPTIGVDFTIKRVTLNSGEDVRLQIWDLSGNDRLRGMIGSYYRRADAALVVYDTTDRFSFANSIQYVTEIAQRGDPGIRTALVGTKVDLVDLRQVETATAQQFATDHGMEFFEVSSLDNKGVDLPFDFMAAHVAPRQKRAAPKKGCIVC